MARMPSSAYRGALAMWMYALVASKTMSGSSVWASSQSIPSADASSPALRARSSPSLSRVDPDHVARFDHVGSHQLVHQVGADVAGPDDRCGQLGHDAYSAPTGAAEEGPAFLRAGRACLQSKPGELGDHFSGGHDPVDRSDRASGVQCHRR